MLLSREEMRFDFGGAKFDIRSDAEILGWIVSQFLYGEVTGIQIGHWLERAPDLDAAKFLSRQAVEELQHVQNFLSILEILGARAEPPHRIVRFLATGAMPSTWAEHVAMEMAIGEGLVLQCFYALIETINHPEVVNILERGVRQEERHVEFGEARTSALVKADAQLRRALLGQFCVTVLAVERLGSAMLTSRFAVHPVLRQLPQFTKHCVQMLAERARRMGVTDLDITAFGLGRVAAAFADSVLTRGKRKLLRLGGGRRALTDTYLEDPWVRKSSSA